MKLRTHLSDSTGKVIPASGWTTKSLSDDLNHDAMAAHALMQAIEELKDISEVIDADGTPMPVREGLPWLKWRADELMRDWTTKQDEVK